MNFRSALPSVTTTTALELGTTLQSRIGGVATVEASEAGVDQLVGQLRESVEVLELNCLGSRRGALHPFAPILRQAEAGVAGVDFRDGFADVCARLRSVVTDQALVGVVVVLVRNVQRADLETLGLISVLSDTSGLRGQIVCTYPRGAERSGAVVQLLRQGPRERWRLEVDFPAAPTIDFREAPGAPLLDVLAVAGGMVPSGVVERALAHGTEKTGPAGGNSGIDPLVERWVIRTPTGGDGSLLSLASVQMRRERLSRLLPADRRHLHGALADAYEAHYGGTLGPLSAEWGRHLLGAGRHRAAAVAFLTAGKREMRFRAWRSALQLLRLARLLAVGAKAPEIARTASGLRADALRDSGRLSDAIEVYEELLVGRAATPEEEMDLRFRVVTAYNRMKRHAGAEAHVRRLEHLVIRAGDPVAMSRLYLMEGLAHRIAGENSVALRLFRRAAGVLDDRAPALHRANVYRHLGNCAGALGRNDDARQWFERALRTLDPIERAHQHQVYTSLAIFHRRMGELGPAHAAFERALDAATQSGDTHAMATGRVNLGNLCSDRGDWKSADGHYRAAQGLAVAAGLGLPDLSFNLCHMALVRCELPQLRRTAADAIRGYRRSGRWRDLLHVYDLLAGLALQRGDLSRHRRYLEAMARTSLQLGTPEARSTVAVRSALGALRAGDTAQGRQCLREALGGQRHAPVRLRALGVAAAARLFPERGPSSSRRLFRIAVNLASRNEDTLLEGLLCADWASFEAELGEIEAAAPVLRRAQGCARRHGGPFLKNRVRIVQCGVELTGAPVGLRERGIERLDEDLARSDTYRIFDDEVARMRARLRGGKSGRRGGGPVYRRLLGESRAMRRVFRDIERVVRDTCTVLVVGASGTGKEQVARTIHENGPRADRPFVAVNCGALAESLLESQLFGHIRGAFTGADRTRKGLIEASEGGTLFLDEIHHTSPGLQVKLLRALREREVTPVGSIESIPVDVRVLCATNEDLRSRVLDGSFREDLYYRIHVVEIALPSLRDRVVDIPLLAQYFLARFCAEKSREISGITTEALEALQAYTWPGNVGELMAEMERAVVFTEAHSVIDLEVLSDRIRRAEPLPGKTRSEGSESERLERLIRSSRGNLSRVAREFGCSRPTLYKMLDRYDLRGLAADAKQG